MAALLDDELQRLYAWVDEIPLSRPKRNIARDFADGVLTAELCHHYFPRLVDLHNYPPANSMQQKLYNWDTLNARVLRKLGAALPRHDVEAVCQCAPGAIERVLNGLQLKMARYRAAQAQRKKLAAERSVDAPADAAAAAPARAPAGYKGAALQHDVDQELLIEKEQEVHDLRETVDILEQKIAKLEQLVRLKDTKIQKLKEAAAAR